MKTFNRTLTALALICAVGLFSCSEQKKKELTLQEAYKDYFPIGAAINMSYLNDSAKTELLKAQFASVTAENDMKCGPLQPRPGEFNWKNADRIAEFAKSNGKLMRGHCLVWHKQMPDWFLKDDKGELVTKEVLFERMRTHIFTVMEHFKGVAYAWDVVNEAITDDPEAEDMYRQSPLYQIAGDEFIRKAFEYAHEADPNAILFYNDYNESNPAKRDRIYNMVKEMRESGVPIQGIGLQGHWRIGNPTEEDLRAAIEKYASLGVILHVTELDVRITQSTGGQLQADNAEQQVIEFTPEIDKAQADYYAMVFRVFRDYKNAIKNVTFWNLTDGDTWLDRRANATGKTYPLLFDANLKPKSSYYEVVDFNKTK